MAGRIGLKLGEMIEGMSENVKVDRGQVGGPQVPLQGHRSEIKSPNRARKRTWDRK